MNYRALGWLPLIVACSSAPAPGEGSEDGHRGGPTSWDPAGEAGACNVDALLSPHASGTKVKTLLTGKPLTSDELTLLEADPSALAGLVDDWSSTPEADDVLERFFNSAFQVTGGNNETLYNLMGKNALTSGRYENPRSAPADELLNKNFADSFAKTALDIVRSGRPFTDVLTTDTFMMTTAMMMFLAFTDDHLVLDSGNPITRTSSGHFPTIRHLRDPPQPPIEQVLDPNHVNYMSFYNQHIERIPGGCGVGSVLTIDTTQQVDGEWEIGYGATLPYLIFKAIALGRVERVRRRNGNCSSGGEGYRNRPILDRVDFADWRPVRVRKPAADEDPSLFYRVLALRDADELRLHTERMGFLTHPGFLSTWMTNEDNSARVTINQALIVALGGSYDGETVTDFTSDAINQEHAAPGSECYGCHQQLDPMRDFYRASFTNFYGQQTDEERSALPGEFVFGGVEVAGSGVSDLANILAEHPRFARGWAQKLCFYANAGACPEGDELDRVVAAFSESNHDFRVLIRELFSSPLVAGDECVDGSSAGTGTMIARRSTFCGQLSVRLGLEDVCSIYDHVDHGSSLQQDMAAAVASIPDDTFSRSVVEPVTIAETGLFTRANREAACDILAQDGFATVYADKTRTEILSHLVESVMGLPTADADHQEAYDILDAHVSAAIDQGETETLALQSAVAVACMSPGSTGVGF